MSPSLSSSQNGRTPSPGDEDFLDFVVAVHRAGQITTAEALDRERTQKLVESAREARAS